MCPSVETGRSRSRSPPRRAADGEIVRKARDALTVLCAEHRIPESHGMGHACRVLGHAEKALEAAEAPVSAGRALAVRLAALLHDADDRKYFPKGHEDCPNARRLMEEAGAEAEVVSDALRMIGVVSCSKNGNKVPAELAGDPCWLWPRWADRLEATGEVGIVRCWQMCHEKGESLFCAETPRPKAEADVWSFATEERFEEYQKSGGKSVSMMDHFFDKLLRVARPDYSSVRNAYLEAEMDCRAAPLVNLCLEFGRTGAVPEDLIREMATQF